MRTVTSKSVAIAASNLLSVAAIFAVVPACIRYWYRTLCHVYRKSRAARAPAQELPRKLSAVPVGYSGARRPVELQSGGERRRRGIGPAWRLAVFLPWQADQRNRL